ncbi:MAG: hypothetical protein GEU93_17685 [Propionibacteriales bacterium]|nr:hypothetical protein [Propionibacteriales bacterium]
MGSMLAGLLLAGPASQAAASACAPAPNQPDMLEPVNTLVSSVSPIATDTRIHWTRWHKRVLYGRYSELRGQVVTDDGAIPDASVDLYTRRAGSSEWVKRRSTTTDSDTGVFVFDCLRPRVTISYRVVYDGTLLYEATRGMRTTRVVRRVPDSMSQVAPERFRYRGSVEPSYAERRVLLQRKACTSCRWNTVQRTQTNDRSRWRFTINTSGYSGRRWFRAVVPGDKFYARSVSFHVWRITS